MGGYFPGSYCDIAARRYVDAPDWVLASINPPSVWNFYATHSAAQANQDDANEYNVRLEAHGAPKRHYAPMTAEDFRLAERAYYLGGKPEQTTKAKFWEALEALPPLRWRQGHNFEYFLMSEFWSGNYTRQYARRGLEDDTATYWTRLVDATDPSTWMAP